ncbi:sigma factor [Mycobacterium avium]|uniref:sigma factor n=1 Tax=Mycobacterium avium TaxID=1764 RepID=UPI0015E20627|nr:sigma factor [Mycobacterium avium]
MVLVVLGSASEADDAVQEAWIRLDAADAEEIRNLRGWLTTVIARPCLDMLRTRKSRREELTDYVLPDADLEPAEGSTPEDEVLVVDRSASRFLSCSRH